MASIDRLRRELRWSFRPESELMQSLTEVERTTGGLEVVVDQLNAEPVVLAAVDLTVVEAAPCQGGALQVDAQQPSGVVQIGRASCRERVSDTV